MMSGFLFLCKSNATLFAYGFGVLFLQKMNVRILFCLLVSLTVLSGCTNKTVTNTEHLFPPAAYLVPCERTEFSGETYGDAVEHLIKVIGEREQCARQIEQIRMWREQVTK